MVIVLPPGTRLSRIVDYGGVISFELDLFGQQDGSHPCAALLSPSPSCPLSFVAPCQQCGHLYIARVQMLVLAPNYPVSFVIVPLS